ncbi:MAG: DUF924 domain-containing protein [Kofleriaceae bacterium]|nr:DUF924 domain-containing protein [Kofleriaceae bacterium]MBP9206246.1 DUF924 domain-containing protein [Kofleriaceae bacterium]
MSSQEDLLTFWFGPVQDDGTARDEVVARWWNKNDAFDAECRARFLPSLDAAMVGRHDAWARTPAGRTALIVLTDQLPRNVFRGTPRAFATDALALEHSKRAVAAREHLQVPVCYGYFQLMPFMHSEALADQERGVELFQELTDHTPAGPARASVAPAVDFAARHRDIVRRFGRFPHRNVILGRDSSPDELEFLTQPGSSF